MTEIVVRVVVFADDLGDVQVIGRNVTVVGVATGPVLSSCLRVRTSSCAPRSPISSSMRFSVCNGFPRLSRAF